MKDILLISLLTTAYLLMVGGLIWAAINLRGAFDPITMIIIGFVLFVTLIIYIAIAD